jgi:ABC-type branched-subunit amino acid transport system ATPase component/ABC-type branched-subunit amino acid transport system permease subunit
VSFSIASFEITGPSLALGLITGMTYGILAVGLVLIYRSNRVINFAHGEIGAFAAALLALGVGRWGMPYWVAFPIALLIAAGVGGISEVVVIRRLRNAPTLMSVIATLGLSQFLLIFALVIYNQGGSGRVFPQPPWLPEFSIGALRITHAYSGMLFITPVIVIGLALFLRYSRTGIAILAAADNPDAARMSGVYASRMSTLSWAIGGAVAAFTALLVLPTHAFGGGEFLGPTLLLRALAAAVVARMVSLPIALVAGIGVGIIEQLILWNYPTGGLVEAVLFVIILLALLAQRPLGGRDTDRGGWTFVQAWPPLPDALRAVWSIRNLGRIVAGIVAAVALFLALVVTNATSITLIAIVAFSIVGLSFGVVSGLGGQLTFGQFALAAVGATVSYVITINGGDYALGLMGAGVATAAASVIVGLPALRVRGLMLAVTTLAFALAAQGWLLQQSWMMGEGVNPGRPKIGGFAFDTGKRYYLFTLAVLVFAVWLARNVWTGGVGRRLRAVRDNEDGARAFTVPATTVKLQGFAVAGFLAGVGGAVFGHALSQINASAFPVASNIDVAAMSVLGGIGILAGPLLGALYIIGVPRFLPLDNAGLAATALGWLVLIVYLPGGIAQLVRPLRQRLIDTLARRAGVDPSAGDRRDETEIAAPAFDTIATRARERTSGSEVLLATDGLVKRFGGVVAVNGVSLELYPGETLGLIGPNGAGKTTLFELIGGFTAPDEGRVRFAGNDITGDGPEARGRAGLVRSFQDAALFPTLTVTEVVELALERSSPTLFLPSVLGFRGQERRKEHRARELIELMGLGDFRSRRIVELSTGTRRIAELACLVALEPTVLLLDEPSSGIAQRETEALGELLLRLRDALDVSMIVIEHDMPLITTLSDRLIAMESGKIVADGVPDDVLRDPAVVASYLGGDVKAIRRSGKTTAKR